MDTAIDRLTGYLIYLRAKSLGGIIRHTLEGFGRVLGKGCKRDTARKVVRFLQAQNLLQPVNVHGHAGDGKWHRLANAYFLATPDTTPAPTPDATAAATPDTTPGPSRRHWSEWASVLGLHARSFGFNRWPERARSHPPPD
jgi:hypothetical protein